MNLVALKTFLTIIETGNLVRASEKLNVSQSTITARLNALESDLGQSLLHRQKSGIVLTASGYKFMRYAEIMTGIWQQARQEISLPEGVDAMCNIGCHMDLWDGIGRALFNEVQEGSKTTAMSIWPGEQGELDRWLGTGLVDAALSYQPVSHGNQTIHALHSDKYMLYSTNPDGPIRFDPNYVFVDAGEDFRKDHAAAYSDSDTARISFGCAVWAMEHLLEKGGSAYLPQRLAKGHVESGKLFVLNEAPVFNRNIYLITNDLVSGNWSWLPGFLDRFSK